MPYVFVFAAGFFVGRTWDTIKGAVAPLLGDAAQRFDELYANTARTVTRTIEDVEDRVAERRYRTETLIEN